MLRLTETEANISCSLTLADMLFSIEEGCNVEGWLFLIAHLAKHNENTVCAPNINVLLCNTAVPQNIWVLGSSC